MDTSDTDQTLWDAAKRRDKRKEIIQGIIVLGMCLLCKSKAHAATLSETNALDVLATENVEELETIIHQEPKAEKLEAIVCREQKEEKSEVRLNLMEVVRNYQKERLEKETEMQKGREVARAKERQEARRQAMQEEQAKREAEEKAEKEKFIHLLPEADFLARVIETEAAKSQEDRRRVGSVVLNRVRTTYLDFRNVHTVKEVFYQGQQYSSESKRAIARGIVASPESTEVAYGLITGEIPCLEEEVLFQSKRENAWMAGKLKRANLANAEQYYGIPLNFEQRCLPEA